jgi:pimeloyl-ACP methyl ester carboxylesterase
MMAIHPVFDETLSAQLTGVVDKIGLIPDPKDSAAAAVPISQRQKRGFDRSDRSRNSRLSLVTDADGIVHWVYQPAPRGSSSRRARRAARQSIGANAVHEIDIVDTPPNQVLKKIQELDDTLTPKRGLRRLAGGTFDAPATVEVPNTERTLLLVHGTFSKSDMFADELGVVAKADPQRDLLGRLAAGRYQHILAFDHPTLSVSPWLNAVELERALRKVNGPIDVICHSRGGLVVAWWLRNGKRNVENVVFVGAPLQGTSLASPANLRAALDALANIATLVKLGAGATSTFLPFMSVVQGLAAIVAGIFSVAANTPLADAVVGVVPGLFGQSRVGNNLELASLNCEQWATTPAFYAVKSNFEPQEKDVGWQIWKYFRNPKEKLLNWGADLIFQDEPNDLVVNTQSMTQLYRPAIAGGNPFVPITDVHDFGASRVVYHTNYFRQPETVDFIKQKLKL